MAKHDWDIFISHASQDKDSVARPLANHLASFGLKIWLDESEIHVGDSLREKIDQGLAQSRFGVVILSSDFFSKIWTKSELDGLVSREIGGHKVILPIWHNLDFEDVRLQSPMLAGRLAARTNEGLLNVAKKIFKAILKAEPRMLSSRPSHSVQEGLPVDYDMELVRAFIAAGKSPPAAWRQFVTTLSFDDEKYKFETLAGLAELDQLERLDLFDVDPLNIDDLSGLKGLRWLYLSGNQANNVDALANLTNLEYLDLNFREVGDISPLQHLKKLQFLSISMMPVRDLGPLRSLTHLRTLNLAGTLVENLDPLSRLRNLQNLSLWKTRVSDLTPLAHLAELRTLDIDGTNVKEVAPLTSLRKLRFLDAVKTKISDFAALEDIPSLEIFVQNRVYDGKAKINLNEEWQVWYWSRFLSVNEDDLRSLIAKYGNSASVLHRNVNSGVR